MRNETNNERKNCQKLKRNEVHKKTMKLIKITKKMKEVPMTPKRFAEVERVLTSITVVHRILFVVNIFNRNLKQTLGSVVTAEKIPNVVYIHYDFQTLLD